MQHLIDWNSVKLTLIGIGLLPFASELAALAFISTLIYNGIRIVKELKKKK